MAGDEFAQEVLNTSGGGAEDNNPSERLRLCCCLVMFNVACVVLAIV
jgi:hypothetical protein